VVDALETVTRALESIANEINNLGLDNPPYHTGVLADIAKKLEKLDDIVDALAKRK
jgi:hypothetical protein